MDFFKNKTDFEKRSIIISLSFTFLIHIGIVILLSQVAKAETVTQPPKFIEARILKKGKKDGINSKNSKNKEVRRKKNNFLPDKIEKKKEKKREKKKERKKENKKTKKIDKDVVKLKKDKDKKDKKDKKTSKKKDKEDVTSDLLASLNSINPAIPDEKTNKKGGLGATKGDVNGFEDGNETDPNKTIAGSLYERRIAIKIKARWKHPPIEDRKGISATIKLFINPDGTIKFKFTKKSKNRFFNDSITKVLNSIKKVEKPADSFKKYYQKKGIHINFFPKE